MKEKKFISAEQTPVPGYVGEVQEETTSAAVSGDMSLGDKTRDKFQDRRDAAASGEIANPLGVASQSASAETLYAPVAKPELQDSPKMAPWGGTMPLGTPSLPKTGVKRTYEVSEPLAPKTQTIMETTGKSAAQLSSEGKDYLSPQQKLDLAMNHYERPNYLEKLRGVENFTSAAMEHPVVQGGAHIVQQAAYMATFNKLFGGFGSSSQQQAPQTPQTPKSTTQPPKGSGGVIDISDYLKAVGR